MCRYPLVLPAVLLVVACRGDDADAITGRLRLERESSVLIDVSAEATRCAADSTIAVVATGADWAAAIGLRMPWPVDSARALMVAPTAGIVGMAAVGVRPLVDSAGPALIAAHGTVHVDAGPLLGGRFDVVAPSAPTAPDSVRLTGRFSGLTVKDDLCPDPATP